MTDYLSQSPADLIRPDYKIYSYTDQIYKVVHFKGNCPVGVKSDREHHLSYDQKLDSSLSRSRRVVLELALCNDWKYFCTFTIAEKNFDRKDLVTWHKKFSQWLRDQRKKYKKQGFNFDISYVLVPERHRDGSWHMHGLFSDISPVLTSFRSLSDLGVNVPVKLVHGDYYNWLDYQEKFGFCSFGVIKNKVAAGFYVSKYISKSLQGDCLDVGLHLYYPSRGLNYSTLHGDIYGHCAALDKFLVNHYDFCDTGMTAVKDGCDWSFGLEYMDTDFIESFRCDNNTSMPDVDSYFSVVQSVIDGF